MYLPLSAEVAMSATTAVDSAIAALHPNACTILRINSAA